MLSVLGRGGLMAATVRAAASSGSRADLAMECYADGNEAAFAIVYDELAPPLYQFALRELRLRSAAEDVVQQTLLQMHCARDRFVRGAAVRPWAYAIARRLIIDWRRHAAHEARLVQDGASAGPELAQSSEDLVEHRRRVAQLERDLRELATPLREAFTLVKLEGLPVAEAAEILGITQANVKVRTHRAALALRQAEARRERPR